MPRAERKFVFYSEGGGYATYLEPIIRALVDDLGHNVVYVTSAPDDKFLENPPAGVSAFQIGFGAVRTLFFQMLDVDVMVMTMPDLDTFHIKRSKNDVHYVYTHHSLVSCHMVYREAAFDNFDTIFCGGPHHIAEIRAREQQAGLRPKNLVEVGYCRLDLISTTAQVGDDQRSVEMVKTVLIAPSWSDQGLIEQHGQEVIRSLLDFGFKVILRPHPRTLASFRDGIREIEAAFQDTGRFHIDIDADSTHSLQSSDLMISDWSGAALEYALGLLKPVLFVDTDRKVNNPNYLELGIEPIEVWIRQRLGDIIDVDDLADIGQVASLLAGFSVEKQENLKALRDEVVFNAGNSGAVAAGELVALHAHIVENRRATDSGV